ncbi:hypothetical protein [Celeribacter sp.]|uniref:hypothetical protein n=1 Tax=Celeribacter sp. TaxID=1890673 RepID=UPI003A93655B
MRPFISIYAGIVFAALASGGLAAKVLWDEYRSFRQIETTGNDAFLKLHGDRDLSFSPWAIRTQTAVLEMCNEALIAPISSVVPTEDYAEIATRCRVIAQQISEKAPAWGLARFSEARAAAALGDTKSAQNALILSARAAANEGWIAQKRVLLALDLPTSPATGVILTHDLTLLVSTPTTRAWLAQVYTLRPAAQERIISVVETTSNATQNDFVAQVRRLNTAGG